MQQSYISFIQKKFQEKQLSNPRYSLRAFAKSLGLDAGFLSHILKGNRKLSVSRAYEVAQALKLSSSEKDVFIQLVRLSQTKSEDSANLISQELSKVLSLQRVKEMDLDVFATLSNWYHFAILEMSFQPKVQLNPKSIAKKLGIPEMEAKLALERLVSLNLLKLAGGKYVKTEQHLNPKGQTPNQALRNRHRQILQKAQTALDQQTVEAREFQSVTMCIDPALIPEAKKRIQEFAWGLCEFLESKNRKEVYELSLQLFSLEKRES